MPEDAGLTMNLITTRTAECEGLEVYGVPDACPATIESVEPVPGTHLTLATVETGSYGRKRVICGASNCRAGLHTAYIPLGRKVIHGVESDGMLASGEELGINRDCSGIVELNGPLPALDSIIEIDNKSLTHRPDLWGHFGLAREVAAITGGSLTDPVDLSLLPTLEPEVEVEGHPELCPRFSALVFENVTVAPSPLWLQFRLTAIGLNPINNLVDLTNYIAAELAQPMHAYDRALLHGNKLTARPASDGEHVLALNHEDYALTAAHLVIADAAGPVGVAGVIGGLDTAISASTTSIVLEAANFRASSIRKTSGALKIRTDASMRFEKAQDPANTVRALARAIALMRELCPEARLVGGLADWQNPQTEPPPIPLDAGWLNRKLGREVPEAEVASILTRLGFGVTGPGPLFQVTVPSWRATKDISTPDDLVEEIGRMIGYETIPPQAPTVLSTVPPDTPERLYLRRVRAIVAAQGFTEVYNYSFISEAQATELGFAPADLLRVLNPIAQNQSLMRPSLLPGIYSNCVENRKHHSSFRLFEVGREIHKRPEPLLPDEVPHMVLAIHGEEGSLFELKRVAQCLATHIQIRPAEARIFEHPRRTAEVLAGATVVGRLFELHPGFLEGRTAILDLDLRRLAPHEPRIAYKPLNKFPSSGFDLSVFARPRELAADLERRMRIFAGPLLERIAYVREYAKSDRKSVTFRFTVGAPDRTLSSEEVTAVRTAVIDGMRSLGYDLTV
ncbi:MAG: phenylalanine--tRNA ligase subunit beta [Acidobacteriota bacterium]|nr:phenylalanine--tRNA ligase subunit beta [Acidobacteriota bacterium]